MDLYEVMQTTFAARDFTDDPVDDATLARMLENARFAPSGGNRQGWHVIVVRDAAKRQALAELIGPGLKRYLAQMLAGESPYNTIVPTALDAAKIEATPIPQAMLAPVTKAPVLLLVAVDLRVVASFDSNLSRIGVISGASIYPFVWNLLLAARNEGLGGTLTTMAAPKEPEVQRLFGLPEHFAVASVLPIGRPVKQLRKLKRGPVEGFATIDAYDGEVFGSEPSA